MIHLRVNSYLFAPIFLSVFVTFSSDFFPFSLCVYVRLSQIVTNAKIAYAAKVSLSPSSVYSPACFSFCPFLSEERGFPFFFCVCCKWEGVAEDFATR